MFSRRLPSNTEVNAVTRALAALTGRGAAVVDLTESNPTRVELPYPPHLLQPLSDARALQYEPHPLGLPSAREAVAADAGRRGVHVDPAHVVLSASTSEAYTWIFKLLCNPGECVLVPRPSYPLFEHLTRLEGVEVSTYDLEYHGRWEIDFDSVAAAPPATKVVLVVSPNNPTGSYITEAELDRLATICRDRGWALVADEVFADYALDARAPLTDVAARLDVLSFTLGGASKSLGLPQVKLAWMVVGGPAAARDRALAHIQLIADTFLSVSTPVQIAAPALLHDGCAVRTAIQSRTGANLRRAREIVSAFPSCDVLPVEGGWSAVVRVPATRSEERLVLDLLELERVLVHPGYFFDFAHEAFLVISLLVPEARFEKALPRVLHVAHA